MREKNWEKIYVAVDIHDTILRACYDDEETYDFFPSAKEVLQTMTIRDDICLILWSSCHRDKLKEYARHFLDNGIRFDYINENDLKDELLLKSGEYNQKPEYEFDKLNLLKCWGWLILWSFVYVCAAVFILESIDRDRR